MFSCKKTPRSVFGILFLSRVLCVVQCIEYGTDVSFPMHSDHVTTNYDWLPHNTLPQLYTTPEGYVGMPIQPLGNRQEFYSEYLRGCIEHHDIHGRHCLDTERYRTNMNKRQPQSMMNFTDVVRCPISFSV